MRLKPPYAADLRTCVPAPGMNARDTQEEAIANIVLNVLRREGMEPYQVLGWCAPAESDADFELQMHEEHGIEISAQRVKARIHAMVVGPEASH